MITDIVFITQEDSEVVYRYDRLPHHPRVGETIDLGEMVSGAQVRRHIVEVTHIHWQVGRGRLLVHCAAT